MIYVQGKANFNKILFCFQENVGGTTYFYSPEDFTPQHEGLVSSNTFIVNIVTK